MTSNTFKRILYTYQLCRESRTTSSVSTPNFRSRATRSEPRKERREEGGEKKEERAERTKEGD